MTDLTPAMAASLASWRCVQSHDREGWLALMAPDVVIEDPIGQSFTNPDGLGVRGKDAVAAFYDSNIAINSLTVTCEETFRRVPQRDRAHPGAAQQVRGRHDLRGARGVLLPGRRRRFQITNMRGYWNLEGMAFGAG